MGKPLLKSKKRSQSQYGSRKVQVFVDSRQKKSDGGLFEHSVNRKPL